MSRFDFDTFCDRRGTAAEKWEMMSPDERTRGIVPLSVADMEFKSPPCVIDALTEAAKKGIYGYTKTDETFLAALRGWMRRRHGLSFKDEELRIVNGVVPALALAVRAFTQPGQGVIVQPPVYPPFYSVAEANGRRVAANPLVRDENGCYRMNFEELERLAAQPENTLMLLCSPHNPVGRVWTRAELERVWEICERNGVVIASDEIHCDLVRKGRHIPLKLIDERAICLTAPSKTFNIPGLQLSQALIGDETLRARFDAQQRAVAGGAIPYFGRAAAIAAYNEGEAWLDEALEYIQGNYRLLAQVCEAYLGPGALSPLEGTYLAWADFRSLGLDRKQLEAFTRQRCSLVLAEGYIFGREGEGFERFNLALPRAELQKALDRLETGLKEIKRC